MLPTQRMPGFLESSSQTRRTTIDLAEMVRDLGRDFATLAAERHVTLHVAASPGLVLVTDPFAIREALENLLDVLERLLRAHQ